MKPLRFAAQAAGASPIRTNLIKNAVKSRFCAAVIMVVMLSYYVAKTKMPLIKKILYAVILADLFGTAFFRIIFSAPPARSIDRHNNFAICMMLVSTVLFIITAIISKRKPFYRPAASGFSDGAGR